MVFPGKKKIFCIGWPEEPLNTISWAALCPPVREKREDYLKKGGPFNPKDPGAVAGMYRPHAGPKAASQTIIDMAQAAAFQDPRFPPLSQRELKDLYRNLGPDPIASDTGHQGNSGGKTWTIYRTGI